MRRGGPIEAAAAALLALAACETDGPVQGVRAECATPSGALIGCAPVTVATPEEACWRLVECGSIPLDYPDEVNEFQLDWERCVVFLQRLPQYRLDYALACVSASTCDDLRDDSSPLNPSIPTCFRFGQEP